MKRIAKPERETPRSSFRPQQNHFALRPFLAHQPEREESPAEHCETLFSYSLKDVSPYPREPVQPKLRLGPVGDRYEQEADRVARQVVETMSSSDQGAVQRQEEEEEPEVEEMPEEEEELRRKVTGIAPAGGADVGPDLESAIQRARSGGQPLSDAVRQPMERAFGADFGGVRLHTDGQADSLNRSIQARAFTAGQDVFLRQGEFRPGSSEGQRLLAHELTHVVQQNGGAERQPQTSMSCSKVIQRGGCLSKTKSSKPFVFDMWAENIEQVPDDVKSFETGHMGDCVTIIAMWEKEQGGRYKHVIGRHMQGGVIEKQAQEVVDKAGSGAVIYVLGGNSTILDPYVFSTYLNPCEST